MPDREWLDELDRFHCLHKYPGAGRFGSHLGDEAIEVYRASAIA